MERGSGCFFETKRNGKKFTGWCGGTVLARYHDHEVDVSSPTPGTIALTNL